MNMLKINKFMEKNCPKCIHYIKKDDCCENDDYCELMLDLNGNLKCVNKEVKNGNKLNKI